MSGLLRLFFGVAVALVVLMFLYAPANHTADRFVDFLVSEHEMNVELWGSRHGERVLERMQWLRGEATRNRLPGELGKPLSERRGAAADASAAGKSSADVGARLMRSEYFRSVDALFALTAYRIAMVIELLPVFLPFFVVSIVDGAADRARRAKEFVPHKPGVYGVFVGGLMFTFCMFLVIFCFPGSVNPLIVASGIVLFGLLAGRAIAHFLKHA